MPPFAKNLAGPTSMIQKRLSIGLITEPWAAVDPKMSPRKKPRPPAIACQRGWPMMATIQRIGCSSPCPPSGAEVMKTSPLAWSGRWATRHDACCHGPCVHVCRSVLVPKLPFQGLAACNGYMAECLTCHKKLKKFMTKLEDGRYWT